MASPVALSPEHHQPTKGTLIFSYTCVAVTGTAIIAVLIIFCRLRVRRRAPVAAGGDLPAEERPQPVGVDIAKLPESAYTDSARRRSGDEGGEQCSVCLGVVQPGEKVRRLPLCEHLYHVACIDLWLASHTTCPLCRADVEPPEKDGQAASATEHDHDALPPV